MKKNYTPKILEQAKKIKKINKNFQKLRQNKDIFRHIKVVYFITSRPPSPVNVKEVLRAKRDCLGVSAMVL